MLSLDEGYVCFGTGNKDDGGFFYLIRLDDDGNVIWQELLQANHSWMYTYPNKIGPYMEIIGEKILIVGAFSLPDKDTTVLAVIADLEKGVFEKTFVPDQNLTYVSAAYNHNTKILSIACLKCILILDKNLTQIGISSASFTPWTSLVWEDDSILWIGGSFKGGIKSVDHPLMALLDYHTLRDVECFVFKDDKLHDKVLIEILKGEAIFLYSHNTSEKDNCTDQTELVIKKYRDNTFQTYRFQPKKIIMDNQILVKTEKSFFLLVEQSSQSIWVLKF